MFDIRHKAPVIQNHRHQSLGPPDPQTIRHIAHLIQYNTGEQKQIKYLAPHVPQPEGGVEEDEHYWRENTEEEGQDTFNLLRTKDGRDLGFYLATS